MISRNKKKHVIHTIIFMYLCILSLIIGNIYSCSAVANIKNTKQESVEFIKELVNDSLEIVNNSDMSEDKKRQKLSEHVNKFLDINRAAQAVFARLGYKALSPNDKEKVKRYLKKYLLHFYAGAGKLSAMTNAKLLTDPVAEPKGKDFAVTTQFTKNSTPSVKIVWVTNGQNIYYIEIDGVNQIITLRSEMQAAVGSETLMDYINKNLE